MPVPPQATGPSRAVPPEPVGAPGHPIRSVVVVGAGLAGAQTISALRAQGFDGRLTLLGAEGVAPYDRPPLSKHLLDRTDPAWLSDELGVDVLALADDVRLGTPATGLTVDSGGVVVATGPADPSPTRARTGVPGAADVAAARTSEEVRADAVVIASGASATRPPAWGGAVTLHTAADAAALRGRLRPGTRLVVVGAGWIGAEVAGVAAAAGVEVTVVEAAATPLAEALGRAAGALTVPWYAAAGVRLLTGSPAADVRADGVRLADGRWLAADVVLVAVGARPATGWIGSALPRDPDGALRVDATYGVVGAPGQVRAVGDAARRWSPRHGWIPGGHWDGALRGPAEAVRALLAGAHLAASASNGTAAAVSAAGSADPAPYVFSTQFGHELALYGARADADELVLRGDPAGTVGWAALWFAPARGPHGRTLTAALTVDRARDAAGARRLFAGAHLPLLDPVAAADPALALRTAQLS